MKKLGVLFLVFLSIAGVTYITGQDTSSQKSKTDNSLVASPPQAPPQEVPKPKLDYMSTFLSRTTAPLGLKEDQESLKLLRQSKAKWAVRAGYKHILN